MALNNGIQQTNDEGGTLYYAPQDTGVEKDEAWYEQYARYVASKYNFVMPRFANVPLKPNEIQPRWATQVMENEAYIKSEQAETLFNFMLRDELNNPLPTQPIKEQTPFTVFKHIWGNMRKACTTLDKTIFANAITSEALRSKELTINLERMRIDMKKEFGEMQQAGMEFRPMGNQQAKNHDELVEMAQNMQDEMSSYFTAFAKDFLYSQNWEKVCSKMAEYLIPSYFCRVQLIPANNTFTWKVYRPAMCIWDNSADDELGQKERFQGVVDNMSIPELLSVPEYKWTKEEATEMRAIARETSVNSPTVVQLNSFAATTDLTWWGMLDAVPTIARVRSYFISFDEETERETWYQCDLIGNKWVKNCKKVDNLVLNKDGSVNPPLLDFIPEITYGKNVSIIQRMREISALITGIDAKINTLIGRAKGKIPVFNTGKFAKGQEQPALLKMIATGLVSLTEVDIDDMAQDKRNNLADVLDLSSTIQDIQGFRQEVLYWENKLREMASIPLVALGAQTDIIGAKVQQQTIEQSTYGMFPLYHGFMLYINYILQNACEMKKNLLSTVEDSEKVELQISQRQKKLFVVTKEFSLADLQIYLAQSDQIDEADRAHIQAIAERESSKPETWFDALDAAELLAMNTKIEQLNYLRIKKRQWEEKRAIAAQMQEKAEKEAQAMQLKTQQSVVDTQVEGSLANTAMKGKIDGENKLQAIAAESVLEEGKEKEPA